MLAMEWQLKKLIPNSTVILLHNALEKYGKNGIMIIQSKIIGIQKVHQEKYKGGMKAKFLWKWRKTTREL